MKDVIFDDFQNTVEDSLLRHRSLIDILSKLQESDARVNRAISKAITNCGCIKVNGQKQQMNFNVDSLNDEKLKNSLNSHVIGDLCDSCRDIVERELGNHLFYVAALCNTLDLNMYDILLKENDKINTLGKFSFR
ncbi:hypothetical protein [Clostridium cellulovorans]|uniref:DUF1573 domain-containing protein n=1 Tax=Clostridium cellulovorans (strain ATCC 35296 / DSM 3052 / OCM 3 / 743B) TaxID=573061 RepID=D9SXC4_CLOC7|nr:hypothetical protein [Clostridium cellulovorans]ADL53427.1 hypothetical protein Clocel_3757 [Clostridium cellulovorans 743B]